MMSEVFPSTGNDVIDTLRGLQFVVDYIDDPDLKIAKVRQGIQLTKAASLCNHNYMVSTTDDSLSLNFLHPDVIGVEPEEVDAFKVLTFKIPILAIETCINAEAS